MCAFRFFEFNGMKIEENKQTHRVTLIAESFGENENALSANTRLVNETAFAHTLTVLTAGVEDMQCYREYQIENKTMRLDKMR